MCDATYPYVSADAAAGLNMEQFLERQAPIIAGQMNNWFKAVANGWGSPGRGRAPHYNISTPVTPRPRRSLQGTCSTTDGLLQARLDGIRFCSSRDTQSGTTEQPGWLDSCWAWALPSMADALRYSVRACAGLPPTCPPLPSRFSIAAAAAR